MTTFASPMRVREVCDNCKRHGFGHGEPCGCNVVTLPAVPEPSPAEYEPDAFTVAQEERDRIARGNDEMGDACRRWTTCGHTDCDWSSPEREYYWQIDRDEDDHAAFGCTHREPAPEPVEVGPEWIWPPHVEHPFQHRMEPLREATPFQRRKRRDPGSTSGWVPAVLGSRAA